VTVLPIPNFSQQDATFLDLFIFANALHVSGGSSAHHQEHTTVHTASGIVKLPKEPFSSFDIHMSVHRNIIPNYSQQDATFLHLFIFYKWCTCF